MKATWIRRNERVERAVANNEKIMVYGDYDVDGCTAVALVYKFLRQIGHKNLMFYIPDRYTEGYGISIKGIDLAARKGVGLHHRSGLRHQSHGKDCLCETKGVDSIICDHHLPGRGDSQGRSRSGPQAGRLPYPFDELSGCGVIQARASLCAENAIPSSRSCRCWTCWSCRSPGHRAAGGREPYSWAYFGLKYLNREPSKGLLSIIKICGLDKHSITIDDIVFKIGPRINAAGRMRMDENDENACPRADTPPWSC